MQSHSCEILYETCLDGVIFPAIYSIAFRIATCLVFFDGIVVAGKGFQHENNITVFCSKEPGNPVEIVLWFLVAGKGPYNK